MRLNKLIPAQGACFVAALALSLAACRHAAPVAQAPPPVAAPPAVPHTLVVLLPDPDGKATGLTVTNAAGAQTLNVPYQAVTIDRGGAAPSAPFAFDQPGQPSRVRSGRFWMRFPHAKYRFFSIST